MRYHFWQFLIDETGAPIKNAEINIFLAGTDTPLYVYFNETGPDGTNKIPQLYTNANGLFEFWVGMVDSDEHGYTADTKIKISWSKMGVFDGQIDYINVFPMFHPVDLISNDIKKNKLISNELGKRWDSHVKSDNHIIHGINEVDINSSLTTRNRLISNKMAKDWEEHRKMRWDDVPHGIQMINIHEPEDFKVNKLVSNEMIRNLSTITSTELPLNLGLMAKSGEMLKPARVDHVHSYENLMTIEHPANVIEGLISNDERVKDISINEKSISGISNMVARADHTHTLKNFSHHQLINQNNDDEFLHISLSEKNKYNGYDFEIKDIQNKIFKHVVVNGDYNCNSFELLLIDSRMREVEIKLPEEPNEYDQIKIIDIYDNFNINNVIIDGNGKYIKESYSSIILNVSGFDKTFIFINNNIGWIFIN